MSYPGISYTQNGYLDKTFGRDGKVITIFNDSIFDYPIEQNIFAIALQEDQKIVVGGIAEWWGPIYSDFAIVRYHSNGMLDSSFGANGKVLTDFGVHDFCVSLLIQSDQKIIASGYSYYNNNYDSSSLVMTRYNLDGSLDSTFGLSGKVIIRPPYKVMWGGYSCFQSNNHIIIVGTVSRLVFPGNKEEFTSIVFVLDTSGRIDSSYGWNGMRTGDIDGINCVTVQSDGKIICVGATNNWDVSSGINIIRYLENGMIDNSFGTNGVSTTSLRDGSVRPYSIMLDKNKRILVTGYSHRENTFSDFDIFVMRYKENGDLDSSFGTTGKCYYGSFTENTTGTAILTQLDDKIIIAGYGSTDFSADKFMLLRINMDGTVDSTFGINGYIFTSMGGESSNIWSALFQPDGKLLTAGNVYNGNDNDFAMARYIIPVKSGIQHSEERKHFSNLYPNPANRKIYFEYELSQKESITISIINLFGVTIYIPINNEIRSIGKHIEEIELDDSMPPATYFLTLRTSEGIEIKKVVIN